ncbi:hypothetical protein [Corallococcus exiguus]|uniref:hypothetical protein n=1 Tax=Corallococcus exiguus TaxID=83462 RepID=UPI001560DC89|nr:hypothetical protein [Corallococcus exiguus]NRD47630.1 hypothetical protein [Corallococcus exiguus]
MPKPLKAGGQGQEYVAALFVGFPVSRVEGSETVPTPESALSSQCEPKVVNRWTTLERHVNLMQWSLPARSIVSVQYGAAKYMPNRAGLIGRYSTKARQGLVKEFWSPFAS